MGLNFCQGGGDKISETGGGLGRGGGSLVGGGRECLNTVGVWGVGGTSAVIINDTQSKPK